MNTFLALEKAFLNFLATTFAIPLQDASKASFDINTDPDKQQFGDINSNAAMVFARELKQNPRTIATQITENFKHPLVARIELAGPGFLNIFVTEQAFVALATEFTHQAAFRPAIAKQKINLEFVSANPTGPLHLGHGRNAILGDTLARILQFNGNSVTKEFYINDAGVQMDKLATCLKIRCQQELGLEIAIPEDGYQGSYLTDLAKHLVATHGADILLESHQWFLQTAQDHMLTLQQQTLHKYGINFDVWFSEKKLKEQVDLADLIHTLTVAGYTYEEDGALWFKTTAFGDDKDRVLRKSDGEYTYLTGDIPYLLHKLNRGFEKLIMILGHDHHGYVVRLHSLLQAFGYKKEQLDVILYQLVHITKEGQALKLSKRAGTVVSIDEIIEVVGKDVTRFFFLNKKADAELELDITLALEQSSNNPVYYIQYAYVRCHALLAKAQQELALTPTDFALTSVTDAEKMLIKKIASLQTLLGQINSNYQTHLIAYYTYELAHLLHAYYKQNRILDDTDLTTTKNRLGMIVLAHSTLGLCLELMGLSQPTKM